MQSLGPPVSRRRVTNTLDMMKRAEGADGASDPRATDLRKRAWKEYDDAKAYAADGDNGHASTALARALADATLALALAEKRQLEQQIAQMDTRIAELRRPAPGARP